MHTNETLLKADPLWGCELAARFNPNNDLTFQQELIVIRQFILGHVDYYATQASCKTEQRILLVLLYWTPNWYRLNLSDPGQQFLQDLAQIVWQTAKEAIPLVLNLLQQTSCQESWSGSKLASFWAEKFRNVHNVKSNTNSR